MKSTGPHAFISQPLLFILVAICCSGSIGLGMVSMRSRNSRIANENRQRANEVADLQRSIASTNTAIELEQSFDMLRQRNQTMRLGLVPLSDPAVVIVDQTEDPVRRLALRASREFRSDTPVIEPVRFAFGN